MPSCHAICLRYAFSIFLIFFSVQLLLRYVDFRCHDAFQIRHAYDAAGIPLASLAAADCCYSAPMLALRHYCCRDAAAAMMFAACHAARFIMSMLPPFSMLLAAVFRHAAALMLDAFDVYFSLLLAAFRAMLPRGC